MTTKHNRPADDAAGRKALPRRSFVLLTLAVGIAAAASVFDNPGIQHPVWTVPYLSGASNLWRHQRWMFDPEEIDRFDSLSPEEQASYRFRPSDNARPYTYFAKGFVYIAFAARNIFFWMGDLRAIETMQVIVHACLTILVMRQLPAGWPRAAFYILYGLNPLVLHVVTFPIYYFWQVIPSAFLACYLANTKFRLGWAAPWLAPLLALVQITRPSTVLIIGMLGLVILGKERPGVGIATVIAALASGFVIFLDSESFNAQPWHTMYVGVGAYPNPYMEGLSDHRGMDRYEQERGRRLTFRTNGSAYEPGAWHEYHQVLREAYLDIARERPDLLIRNAALNFFQSYSLGYITRSHTLSYASAAVGALWLAVLIWRRELFFALAIGMNSLTFTVYFPPIPVYMFGAYVLLVASFVCVILDLINQRSRARDLALASR